MSWTVAEVHLIPLSSFMSCSLHSWLASYRFRPWRFFSYGEAREGSSLGRPLMKHSFFESSVLFLMMKGSGVISSLSCTSWKNPFGFLGGMFWSERRKFFIWRIFCAQISPSFPRDLRKVALTIGSVHVKCSLTSGSLFASALGIYLAVLDE